MVDQEKLRAISRVESGFDWLCGLGLIGVVGTCIYLIWTNEWKPLATAIVLQLFFALFKQATKKRREEIEAGKT